MTPNVDTDVRSYGIFIDGRWTDGASGRYSDVLNPATEEVVARVTVATADDTVAAIRSAREAFDHGPWPRMSVEERRSVMHRMLAILERRRDELVDINVTSGGATRPIAAAIQIDAAIAHFRDMVDRVMVRFDWERPSPAHVGAGIGQGNILREPFGVAALISAYNFPLLLNIVKLAPALASGCTSVLKPASTTPIEAIVLGEIAEEAGLPAGVLNVITGDREVSYEMSTNPMVDLVSFTGSDNVGKLIYAQAATSLKKVVLELGGKSPLIVTEDADIDAAAQDIILNTTLHAGQGCSLLTRAVVHRSRADELTEAVRAGFAQMTLGDPADPATAMGPLISAAQRDKVLGMIADGVREGAKIAYGGTDGGQDRGFFVEPTLFTDVHNSMSIAQKEFFGPVNVVIPFDTDEEAVRIANDSEFGLWAAVRSADPVRAYGIAKRLRAGTVSLNGGGGAFPNTLLPYGGYKSSGLGREYGEAGLDEYLETKSVVWGVAGG
ncbi:aldehyde dehydrogenase family protein [Leucobacter allii]|uniref:Aldehyde dehydrogenase family protein n=1 Tax=Leucobacter allii TaxID=2932247 RepID=A0ABY4FMK8_9MICO|nr:aldehyde dehydrogenase family protein [Leucobacter allii]UOQ57521.1 aldehyde dehydrogenase family protein [Leucobacter allii]